MCCTLRIAKYFNLRTEWISDVVAVAYWQQYEVLAKLLNNPVISDDPGPGVDFEVSRNISFDIDVGRPTLMHLDDILNLRSEKTKLAYSEPQTVLLMDSKHKKFRDKRKEQIAITSVWN